jgi:aryl-alcohol dehydrogenase-like predicted oxidoreductase
LAVQAKEPWPNCISISGPMAAAERAWYAEQQMPLFTWSSLAGGFFSGRFHRDNLVAFESYQDKLAVETYCTDENFLRLDRAQKLAEEKGLTVAQIATAYVTSYPLNIYALVGCWKSEEFRDNVAAAEVKLTETELAWLDLRRDDRQTIN